ncbi:MAG: hypothetical protein ABWY27_11780 [Telluria sp.]
MLTKLAVFTYAALLAGCGLPGIDPTWQRDRSLARNAEAEINAAILSNELSRAAAIYARIISRLPTGDFKQSSLQNSYARLLAAMGRRDEAIGVLDTCTNTASDARFRRSCQDSLLKLRSGEQVSLQEIRSGAEISVRINREIAQEAAEEAHNERRTGDTATTLITAGLAGMQTPSRSTTLPAYAAAAGLAQQGRPSPSSPSPAYSNTPAKRLVNECISIRTNQWGSREFYNQCGFTVGIAWCNSDATSPYFCKDGITRRGVDFIGSGKATGGVGKSGIAHWAACQGGAGGGNYPQLKNGVASCR